MADTVFASFWCCAIESKSASPKTKKTADKIIGSDLNTVLKSLRVSLQQLPRGGAALSITGLNGLRIGKQIGELTI